MANEIIISDNSRINELSKDNHLKVLNTPVQLLYSILENEVLSAYALSGIDTKNKPRIKIIVDELLKLVNEKYKSFSHKEIKIAFKEGLLDSYGDYNKGLPYIAFAKFLKGYKDSKIDLQNTILGRQEAQKNEVDTMERAEKIKALESEYLENKFREFEEVVKQCVVHIQDGESFGMDANEVEIPSILNAIKKYTLLSITEAQEEWIDSVVKEVSYNFDIDRRSIDKGAYQKRKKLCQHKHKERLTLELFLCKRLKEETGINPTTIFTFTLNPNQ